MPWSLSLSLLLAGNSNHTQPVATQALCRPVWPETALFCFFKQVLLGDTQMTLMFPLFKHFFCWLWRVVASLSQADYLQTVWFPIISAGDLGRLQILPVEEAGKLWLWLEMSSVNVPAVCSKLKRVWCLFVFIRVSWWNSIKYLINSNRKKYSVVWIIEEIYFRSFQFFLWFDHKIPDLNAYFCSRKMGKISKFNIRNKVHTTIHVIQRNC